jgi:hypothetical protein
VIEWQFYPRTQPIPDHLRAVVDVLNAASKDIGSSTATLKSNKALGFIADGLTKLGFRVETGTKRVDKIPIPLLFGPQGKAEKSFHVDAYSAELRTVVEIEAGRAFANNQFLKDLFEACVMPTVDYLVIAVRRDYKGVKDFVQVCRFLEILFMSDRFELPLEGVLVIGY